MNKLPCKIGRLRKELATIQMELLLIVLFRVEIKYTG